MEAKVFAFLADQRIINAKVKRDLVNLFGITDSECSTYMTKFFSKGSAAVETTDVEAVEAVAAAVAVVEEPVEAETATVVLPAAATVVLPAAEAAATEESAAGPSAAIDLSESKDDAADAEAVDFSLPCSKLLSSSALSSSLIFMASSPESSDEISSFGLGAKASLKSSKIEDDEYSAAAEAADDVSASSSSSSNAAAAVSSSRSFYDLSFEEINFFFEELESKHENASREEILSFFKEKKSFQMRGLVINTLEKYYAKFCGPDGIKALWESDRSKQSAKKPAAPSFVGVFSAPSGKFKRQAASMQPTMQPKTMQPKTMQPATMQQSTMQPAMMQPAMMQQHAAAMQQYMMPFMMPPPMPPHMMPHMMHQMQQMMSASAASSPILPHSAAEGGASGVGCMPFYNPYWPSYGQFYMPPAQDEQIKKQKK